MKNKITIYDVAKEANVSLATVSRVINNSDVVKENTRDKVLAAIEAYNNLNEDVLVIDLYQINVE